MNIFKSIALSVLMLGSVVTTDNVSAAAAEPYPLEYFALREVISNVSMSPDGNKISLLKIPSKKGDPILEIYDANDLDKPPFRMNADPMEIRQARWISNDQLVLTLRQKLRDKIDGFNRGVYGGALAKLDLKTKKVKEFELKNQSPGIASLLIDKPNKILVSFNGDETYSPTDYYELDLKSGRKKLIIRGTPEVPLVRFDSYGKPIYGQSFDRQTGTYSWHVRYSGSNKWVEIYRHSEDSFEDFAVEWFDENKLVTWHLVSNNCKVESQGKDIINSLFNQEEPITKTHHLIPEYKKVNFFLKISDDHVNKTKLNLILRKIQSIPQIVTAYSLDPNDLRSKNNLIFD